MRLTSLTWCLLLIALSISGCSTAEPVKMPDVTGKKLDVAYSSIQNAGFGDREKIKIEGGGIFGVVTEGNWTVCSQSPDAGENVSDAPTLTVDRACDASVSAGPSRDASKSSAEAPTSKPSATPTQTRPAVLTVKNNRDFAAILRVADNCSDKITRFARKYEGARVRFNGSIAAMALHGNYKTRYDILIGPGDFDPDKSIGPSFQFRDKNVVYDLHMKGHKIPEYVEVGQNYVFTAELEEFNPDNCLYQLQPVETRSR